MRSVSYTAASKRGVVSTLGRERRPTIATCVGAADGPTIASQFALRMAPWNRGAHQFVHPAWIFGAYFVNFRFLTLRDWMGRI